MTTFNDRQRAAESKHAQDQDTAFRQRALRNRLIGAWAGALLGDRLTDTPAYVAEIVRVGVDTDAVLLDRLAHDLDGIVTTDAIQAQLRICDQQAKAQS